MRASVAVTTGATTTATGCIGLGGILLFFFFFFLGFFQRGRSKTLGNVLSIEFDKGGIILTRQNLKGTSFFVMVGIEQWNGGQG
jgi:hypothetical protein